MKQELSTGFGPELQSATVIPHKMEEASEMMCKRCKITVFCRYRSLVNNDGGKRCEQIAMGIPPR